MRYVPLAVIAGEFKRQGYRPDTPVSLHDLSRQLYDSEMEHEITNAYNEGLMMGCNRRMLELIGEDQQIVADESIRPIIEDVFQLLLQARTRLKDAQPSLDDAIFSGLTEEDSLAIDAIQQILNDAVGITQRTLRTPVDYKERKKYRRQQL